MKVIILWCLCLIGLLPAFAEDAQELKKPNIDIFPREPGRNCECIGEGRCEPCMTPYEWDTETNECFLRIDDEEGHRCFGDIDVSGVSAVTRKKKKMKMRLLNEAEVNAHITCQANDRSCKAIITTENYCDPVEHYTFMYGAKLTLHNAANIWMHMNDTRSIIKLEEPLEEVNEVRFKAFILHGDLELEYNSTSMTDVHMEFTATFCCHEINPQTTQATERP